MARSPRGGPPWYDVKFRNSGKNRERMTRQAKSKNPNHHYPHYFSHWQNTGKWLRGSPNLDRQLRREANGIARDLRIEMLGSSRESDREASEGIIVRKQVPGGLYRDRIVYWVEHRAGKSGDFSFLEFRSKYSPERYSDWSNNRKKPPGQREVISPDRKGWIDTVLDRRSKFGM